MHGFEQTFFGEVSTSYEEHVSGLGFDDGGRTLSDSHTAVNTFFPGHRRNGFPQLSRDPLKQS